MKIFLVYNSDERELDEMSAKTSVVLETLGMFIAEGQFLQNNVNLKVLEFLFYINDLWICIQYNFEKIVAILTNGIFFSLIECFIPEYKQVVKSF